MIFAAVVVGAVAVALTSVPGLGGSLGLDRFFGSDQGQMLYTKVVRGKLPVTVTERGTVESSNNKDVTNEVEGMTTIIKILPEGTPVEKDQIVCELDSANLRDQLTNQEITTRRAEADLDQATKTLEVAMIAVKEYQEGTFPQDEKSAQGQIKLAQADLVKAQDSMDWYERMAEIGYASSAQFTTAKLTFQKTEFTLQENETKLMVLRKYTKEKQQTELQANVQKATSDKLAKEATYKLEKAKEEKLTKQIDKCILRAPGPGIVVYANESNRFGSNQALIEEGASVRERQPIFKLPDLNKMRVNTKVHESMVNRITAGLKARIRVDSFAQQQLTGTVDQVQPMADANNFFSSDIKVYTTFIAIDNPPDGLRPGMSAQVDILVTQLDNVLSVPVQSILEFKGKDYVFVKTSNGPIRKEVKLGITNDTLIEIKEGLREGEEIAMNPSELLSDDEKREAFATSTKGAKSGEWSADAVQAGKASPGLAPGLPGKNDTKKDAGAEKGKGQGGQRKGQGGNPAMRAIMQKIAPEDRQKMFSPDTPQSEREEILKKAGATDEQIQQMRSFGGGRGPGGGGPPGGGFGGGPPGGGGFGGGGGRGGPGGGPNP